MLTLIGAVKTKLKTRATRVHMGQAQQGSAFPYVTFKFPTSDATDPSEDFFLEVDLWDKNTDATAIENLTDNVDSDFHKWVYNSTGINAHFQRINRLAIDDPDPVIKRRQLRYLVRTYK